MAPVCGGRTEGNLFLTVNAGSHSWKKMNSDVMRWLFLCRGDLGSYSAVPFS